MILLKIAGLLAACVAVFLISPILLEAAEPRANASFRGWIRRIQGQSEDMFMGWSGRRIGIVLLLLLVGVPLITGWTTQSPGLALISMMGAFLFPSAAVRIIRERRRKIFNAQLVDSLGLMASGMRSGLSFQAGLSMAVDQMPPPSSQEFNLVLKAHSVGEPMEKALGILLDRMWSEDLEMVVTSVRILKRVGGNLPEQFDTVVETIRQRQRVEGKIRSLTAQGRYQTVAIGLVGLVLMGGLWLVAPDMMRPLWSTAPGKVCLGISSALFMIGVISMRKLAHVKV